MTAQQQKLIEQLYLQLHDRLIVYAENALGQSLAEEAVQETFRIACQKPDALFASPNPEGWLVLTLKNTIRNIKSDRETARRIAEKYLLSQAKELSVSADGIRVDILYENVAHREEFQLLSEMAIQGRSHEEMAIDRGISIPTCRKRVERAKKYLQRKLKNIVTFL